MYNNRLQSDLLIEYSFEKSTFDIFFPFLHERKFSKRLAANGSEQKDDQKKLFFFTFYFMVRCLPFKFSQITP